jgi:hypothetical protein
MSVLLQRMGQGLLHSASRSGGMWDSYLYRAWDYSSNTNHLLLIMPPKTDTTNNNSAFWSKRLSELSRTGQETGQWDPKSIMHAKQEFRFAQGREDFLSGIVKVCTLTYQRGDLSRLTYRPTRNLRQRSKLRTKNTAESPIPPRKIVRNMISPCLRLLNEEENSKRGRGQKG